MPFRLQDEAAHRLRGGGRRRSARAGGAHEGIDVDVDVLRHEIQKTHTEVSTDQEQEFIFRTGRAWAQDLGYPEPELSRFPEGTAASIAGMANPFALGELEPGQTVLDLDCGAGDASVDVVISNGVIDLVPDKEAVFAEIDRVLRPGCRLQVADVVIHTEVYEDARALKYGAMGSTIRATKSSR